MISGAIPRGNFTHDCKTGTEGDIDYTAVRASVRWLASSDVEVNWVSDATRDNSGTTPSSLLSASPVNTLPWAHAPYDNRYVPKNPYDNYANFLDPGVTYRPINPAGAPGVANGAWAADPNKHVGWVGNLRHRRLENRG